MTLFIHQEEPEDLMDTTSPSVEDIKIKEERANYNGFEVRILVPNTLLQRGRIFDVHCYFPFGIISLLRQESLLI